MNSRKLAIGAVTRQLVRSTTILCLLGVWLWAPGVAYAATVTIQPSTADTHLREDDTNGNFGTDATMRVQSRNNQRNRRSLVQFSLTAIPSGSVITSATLQLYMTAAPTGASRTYDTHRVTRSWSETQATWDRAATGTNWTTPGGDFVGTPTASTTTGTVSGVWLSWDVTADVSAWYNGTASNYGVLIKDNTESSATNYNAQLATRVCHP